jgi:hypothetical protein
MWGDHSRIPPLFRFVSVILMQQCLGHRPRYLSKVIAAHRSTLSSAGNLRNTKLTVYCSEAGNDHDGMHRAQQPANG